MSQRMSTLQEHCDECGKTTAHSVTLEIRREADETDAVGHSRTPYRITECEECGTVTVLRMNNL